jgi:hypothetical protein
MQGEVNMKIWYGYGSEHSMNLVMIGHFKDHGAAEKAKELIDAFTENVNADLDDHLMVMGTPGNRFSDRMLALLTKVSVHIISPSEMEQFAYDFRARVDGNKVVLTTDESEVSAFLKLLVEKGARVEVYSAHEYPNTEYGRGK